MLTRVFVAAMLSVAPAALAQSVAGPWDATVKINNLVIPFRIEFGMDGSTLTGTLFNGDERFTSTGGHLEDGKLTVEWDHYASKLEANLNNGVLTGTYTRGGRRSANYPFGAKPHTEAA